MQPEWTRRIVVVSSILLALLFLQFIKNSRDLSLNSLSLKEAARLPDSVEEDAQERSLYISARKQTIKRFKTYLELIQSDQLDNGLVVSKNAEGDSEDRCDSLLFSALYFVALNKMGAKQRALNVWRAMERSQYAGHWYRHPNCQNATSRDMVVGLLAALSQRPPGYKVHLKTFLNFLRRNEGFVSSGTLDVSFLSPGLAEPLRRFALIEGYRNEELPDGLREAFSTLEFNVPVSKSGYPQHLMAMQVWLEFELDHLVQEDISSKTRTALRALDEIAQPFVIEEPTSQRLDFITQTLFERDPKNLFFEYLRLRSAHALSPKSRRILLNKLNNLAAFPEDRLPRDCDREADYAWQRQSREMANKKRSCNETFPGVDYLWMASLLLEDDREQAMDDSLIEDLPAVAH